MWWMLAGCLATGLIGLEARRVLRNRIDEAGPRRYALYMAGQPERALRIVEVAMAGHDLSDVGALKTTMAGVRDDGPWTEATTRHPGLHGLAPAHLGRAPHVRRRRRGFGV